MKKRIYIKKALGLLSFFCKKFKTISKGRLKICVSGNCQSVGLAKMLGLCPEFNDRFEIELLKEVYLMTQDDVAEYHKSVSTCDILLTTEVSGDYYVNLKLDTAFLKTLLKPESKVLLYPVIYWTGYSPEQFYLRGPDGNSTPIVDITPSVYHNKIIFYGYCNGWSEEKIIRALNCERNYSSAKELAINSLQELKCRENELDFTVSEFIENNYQEERLFYTINHPSNSVLLFLAHKILKYFGCSDLRKVKIRKELLSGHYFPILPGVKKALSLNFCGASFRGLPEDYVAKFCHFYDKYPDLVAINKSTIESLEFFD